jgi:naphthalene 1,2-dioxygenase system ferredoxin subunit
MTNWTDVAAEAELFEVAGIAVTPEGRDIAIFKVEEDVYAIDNICTHGHARLCDGFVDGNMVECPYHQALFDVRDGSVNCGSATEALKSWPVKIENDSVYLDLTV